jgi:hypothetical protein
VHLQRDGTWLVVAGDHDPAAAMGRHATTLAGARVHVDCTLYEDARTELLNETKSQRSHGRRDHLDRVPAVAHLTETSPSRGNTSPRMWLFVPFRG